MRILQSAAIWLPTLLLAAVPVRAADGLGAPSFRASISAVSDYRFRGLSHSDGDPAVQAELGASAGNFFASVWGSSVGGMARGNGEIDVSAGWTRRFALLTTTIGATLYLWPDSEQPAGTEFFTTLDAPLGPATATLGATWSPSKNNPTRSSRYLFGQLTTALPMTPLTLRASAGNEAIEAYDVAGRLVNRKWDWLVGADLNWMQFTLGAAYVGNNLARGPLDFGHGRLPARKQDNGVVVRVRAAF